MTDSFYRVSALHQTPSCGCTDAVAKVSTNKPDHYYAIMSQYGCSKDATSPAGAIRNMLKDHGCYAVSIRLMPQAEGFEAYWHQPWAGDWKL